MTKLAVVTGASSGIGEVFARKLSRMGYRLILVARREERLRKLAAELPDSEFIKADLSLDADLRRIEARIASEPEFEFLVNNAGFGVQGAFHELSLESQESMHRLHIIAIVRLTHAALRSMIHRRKGNIINVSSVAGFLTSPYTVSYYATKAWINSFTEGLYMELEAIHSPVRIQVLCPGLTHTEFHDVAGADPNALPRSFWMSAEDVVDASLRGLKKDRLFVVPGWRYRLFVALYPWIPRSIRHALAIKYGGRGTKQK